MLTICQLQKTSKRKQNKDCSNFISNLTTLIKNSGCNVDLNIENFSQENNCKIKFSLNINAKEIKKQEKAES